MNENSKKESVTEKILHPFSGGAALLLLLFALFASIGAIVYSAFLLSDSHIAIGAILLTTGIIAVLVVCILLAGLKIVGPNEARVFTLFGNYYGTIQKAGFFYVNPFVCSVNPVKTSTSSITIGESTAAVQVKANISTKTMTLSNEKQKVNDVLGNPVIIGSVVIWNVENPTKAVFNVENYSEYLSIQCDSTIRHIARLYPYDNIETDSEEKTLRGSSQEIADIMQKDLQERVRDAGLNIQEVRITHLAYSEEIAAAMLQRQQASAIIAARQKIVEGAVSMVKMAIDQLGEEEIVILDEERKAAMVSNLLVVLCGNKDAQPIVNSGSIY